MSRETPIKRPSPSVGFEFSMDVLGDPEAQIVREYVAAMEAWADEADARVAAERERCAKVCEERAGRDPFEKFDDPGAYFELLLCADSIRGVTERNFPLNEDTQP